MATNRVRVWTLRLGLSSILIYMVIFRVLLGSETAWQSARASISHLRPVAVGAVPAHVEDYFDQVFSASHPKPFGYAALKAACDGTSWPADEKDHVYLKCGGMAAGLTSIVSQVKVCLKMAVDTGSNLVLPTIPLRDSKDLRDFNFLNGEAYKPYDQWFDAPHLREVMARACRPMKIIDADDLNKSVAVSKAWDVSCADAPGYQKFHPYFWVGRPFRTFFEGQLRTLRERAAANPNPDPDPNAHANMTGITVVGVDSEFVLYRITDDPTRGDLRLWNDLSHVVRFRPEPRNVIARLMAKLTRVYYGVHFRAEKDNIWSSFDTQLARDLDALDRAWTRFGAPGEPKPLVYLACGDLDMAEKFAAAANGRGFEVTHKWKLVENDKATADMINELAFDFQGAVDMGIMMKARFFLGLAGSAFSSTIANQRDVTGRYRGSSFDVVDDEGARTHLFNDGDSEAYACCL